MFDTSELEDIDEVLQWTPHQEQPAAQPFGGEAEPEPPDTYMEDIDTRLAVADCYRELLKSPLFSNSTAAARIVENEHQKWVRSRLQELLNLGRVTVPAPPQAPVQFTDEEVAILKAIVESARKRGIGPKPTTASPRRAPARSGPRPAPVQKMTQQAPSAATPVAVMKPRPAITSSTPMAIEKVIEHPIADDGRQHVLKLPKIQRPTGAIPFPVNLEQISAMASSAHASAGASATNRQLDQ